MKDANGRLLFVSHDDVRHRSAKYHEELINIEDVRAADIIFVGGGLLLSA